MGGPLENENVENELKNVTIIKEGEQLKYDVLFTDHGVLFRHVGDSFATASGKGASVGLKIGDMDLGGTTGMLKKAFDMKNQKMRNTYTGMSVRNMLLQDSVNIYIPFEDVSVVSLKKKMIGVDMCFKTPDKEVKCGISGGMMDAAKDMISKRLGNKLTQ